MPQARVLIRIDLGKWPHLVASFVICLAIVAFWVPRWEAGLAAHTQLAPPDLRFFYTPEELALFLGELGVEGRAFYLRSRYVFDLIWPVAYTYLNIALLANLVPKVADEGHWLRRFFQTIAFAPFVVDLGENTLTGIATASFPEVPAALAWAATGFTAVKWCTVGAFWLTALLCGARWFMRRGRGTT